MHSILYKIKSFPKRKSNRQLLADLLNEYPIDRQYHSLPNIKSPPTAQKPTAKSLLIASAFHQSQNEAILIENEDFDEIEDNANQKPIKRRPTPYAKEEDDDDDEDNKDQQQLDMNKKQIKQLKKIVKIQKKQLDYLLARSSDGYYNPMYSYFDQDEYQYNQPYPQENYTPYQSAETNNSTSHSIPIQYKKRKDDSQLSSSMPNLNDTHNEVKGSHSLPSLGNTNNSSMYNRYSQEDVPTMSNRYSKESASSVPTMYNRYSQESASSGSIPTMYNRYSQDSGIASSVPTMYTRRYSKETYGESVTSMPIPYHHHQDSTYSNNNNNNYSYNNYYSYQYPVPYYYQSNSSTSSVPNYYYPQQQQQEYPSSYFYNIT